MAPTYLQLVLVALLELYSDGACDEEISGETLFRKAKRARKARGDYPCGNRQDVALSSSVKYLASHGLLELTKDSELLETDERSEEKNSIRVTELGLQLLAYIARHQGTSTGHSVNSGRTRSTTRFSRTRQDQALVLRLFKKKYPGPIPRPRNDIQHSREKRCLDRRIEELSSGVAQTSSARRVVIEEPPEQHLPPDDLFALRQPERQPTESPRTPEPLSRNGSMIIGGLPTPERGFGPPGPDAADSDDDNEMEVDSAPKVQVNLYLGPPFSIDRQFETPLSRRSNASGGFGSYPTPVSAPRFTNAIAGPSNLSMRPPDYPVVVSPEDSVIGAGMWDWVKTTFEHSWNDLFGGTAVAGPTTWRTLLEGLANIITQLRTALAQANSDKDRLAKDLERKEAERAAVEAKFHAYAESDRLAIERRRHEFGLPASSGASAI